MTHDAIDAALIEALGPNIVASLLRTALARHGLALVPAGESAAGAARDMRGFDQIISEMTAKHGNPIGTDYEQGVNDHGARLIGQWEKFVAAAPAPHPDQREAAMRSADEIRARLAERNSEATRGTNYNAPNRAGSIAHNDGWIAALEWVLSPSKPQEPPHD